MGIHKQFRFGDVLSKDRILLFGDDILIARVLGKVLKRQGYIFHSIKDYTNIIGQVAEFSPKLVILDYNPSEINIFRLCRTLKQDNRISHIPVVMLGPGHINTRDVVNGLKSGAEDYLFKPLNTKLFLAKIMVILRNRIYHEQPEEILRSKGIVLNLTAHTVSVHPVGSGTSCYNTSNNVNNKPVKLSPKEFALLYFLMKQKGRVLSRKTLMKNVWEQEYFGDMNTINIHIHTLRKKLGSAGNNIENVEGIGYRFKNG